MTFKVAQNLFIAKERNQSVIKLFYFPFMFAYKAIIKYYEHINITFIQLICKLYSTYFLHYIYKN